MAKAKINYVCTQCGAIQPKWMGKCPDCGSWNTLTENIEEPVSRFSSSSVVSKHGCVVQKLEQINSNEEQRYLTQMQELNRVLGGGIVPGSVFYSAGTPESENQPFCFKFVRPFLPMRKSFIFREKKVCGKLN